jgi:hypothetical protein
LSTSGEDFDDGAEVFEAVGQILIEGDATKSERQIRDLCNRLHSLVRPGHNAQENGNNDQKVLSAPVQMGSIVDNGKAEVEENSIWIQVRMTLNIGFRVRDVTG